MADTKISALTSLGSVADEDLLAVVDDPSGTPTTKKATAGAIRAGMISNVVDDTTPQLGGQLDVNGQALGDGTLELLSFTETGSAVNHVGVTNAATGSGPTVSAVGDDTDVDLNLAAKGTGVVNASGARVLTTADEGTGNGIDADTVDGNEASALLARANHTGTQAASTITGLPAEIGVACSDESTAITATGTKTTFRMPHAMTVTAVRANVKTACTTGTFTVDINDGGTTILSTKLTLDATEKTSTTAATPPVISDSALADDAEITIDVDNVGDSTAAGLKVWIIGTRA